MSVNAQNFVVFVERRRRRRLRDFTEKKKLFCSILKCKHLFFYQTLQKQKLNVKIHFSSFYYVEKVKNRCLPLTSFQIHYSYRSVRYFYVSHYFQTRGLLLLLSGMVPFIKILSWSIMQITCIIGKAIFSWRLRMKRRSQFCSQSLR